MLPLSAFDTQVWVGGGGRIVPTLNIKGSFVSASPSAKVRQMSANCGHTRHKIPAEHQLASKDTICFKLAAKLHSLL